MITEEWLDEQATIYNTPRAKAVFSVLRKSYERWRRKAGEPCTGNYYDNAVDNLEECENALLAFCQVW